MHYRANVPLLVRNVRSYRRYWRNRNRINRNRVNRNRRNWPHEWPWAQGDEWAAWLTLAARHSITSCIEPHDRFIQRRQKQKFVVPKAPPDVEYYHSVTKTALLEGEELSESDDELEPPTLLGAKNRDELLDSSFADRPQTLFRVLHNNHFRQEELAGDRYFAESWLRFTRENITAIVGLGLEHEYGIRAGLARVDGLLSDEAVNEGEEVLRSERENNERENKRRKIAGRKSVSLTNADKRRLLKTTRIANDSKTAWHMTCKCSKLVSDIGHAVSCSGKVNPPNAQDPVDKSLPRLLMGSRIARTQISTYNALA